MSLFKPFKQHENESLFSYVLRSISPLSIGVLLVLSFSMLFFSPKFYLGIPLIFFGTSLVLTFVVVVFSCGLFSRELNTQYDKFKIDSDVFLEIDKVNLVKRISSYPMKLFHSMVFGLVLSGLAASFFVWYLYGMIFWKNALIWTCLSAFPSLAALLIASEICSSQTAWLMRESLSDLDFGVHLNGKRSIGISLNSYYSLYVYVPVFTSVAMAAIYIWTTLDYMDLAEIFKLIGFIITDSLLCILSAIGFMVRIVRANIKLQKTLGKVRDSGRREKVKVPANFFTDLSYAAYLMNKATAKYSENLSEHSKNHMTVFMATEKISAELNQVDGYLQNQSELIASIKTKLLDTAGQTEELKTLLDENHRIAVQTTDHVAFGLESVQQNIRKMDEITVANNVSVGDISSLSNEINSIWEIVNIINGIADRTKIIAFNAELEAEAFESENTSFKNVAANIRSLADKIMDLTRNIRMQIMTIQDSNHNLITQGSEFSSRIKEGKTLTRSLENNFMDIRSSAEQSVSYSQSISDILNQMIGERELLMPRIKSLEKLVEELRNNTAESRRISEELVSISNGQMN